MMHKFNKIKSITKGLVGSNIICPATYILLSANMEFCTRFDGDTSKLQINGAPYRSFVPKSNDLEDKNKDEGQVDDVKFVLGRGTVLNLGDELCGVFVTADTKEVFIVKLYSQEGWMRLIEHHPQVGQESEQAPIVRVRYDHIEDPRIIKVDHVLLEHLLQQLDQSSALSACSSNKEDFWHKIQDNPSWREIAFCYKVPFVDLPIFKEDGITSEFTTELYKKYSYTTSRCISSKLSISGNMPSVTLKSFEKVGFLLVKAQPSLVHLVKGMLACDAEWATKAAVAADYITCPAEFVDDLLRFDSKDVANDYSSLCLEDYPSAYCYIQEGEYCRLMTLDQVRFLINTDREPYVPNPLYCEQVAGGHMPIGEHEKEVEQSDEVPDGGEVPLHTEDQNDGQADSINEQQAHTHHPEAAPAQDARHVSVRTSPMQYTGFNATTPLPPPPPTAPSSDLQCSDNNNHHTVHVASTPLQLPSKNTGSINQQTQQNSVSRVALFAQIREGGIKLKSTQASKEQPTVSAPKSTPDLNGIPAPPPPPPMPTGTGADMNGIPVPPPPPPMPLSAGFVLQSVSAPNQGNGVKMAQTTKKDQPLQSSNAVHDKLLAQIRGGVQLKTIEPSNKQTPQSSDGRVALFAQIREGVKLKTIEPSNKQTPQSSDVHDKLLADIRKGKKLKPSNEQRPLKEKTIEIYQNDVSEILARRIAMELSDSESSDVDAEPGESDSEWKDEP